MEQENTFINDLVYFSNEALSIVLDKTPVWRLLYIEVEALQDEFNDKSSFILQDCLINASEREIKTILKNLSNAIKTNCKNNIDLQKIIVPQNFGYSVRRNNKERAISKVFANYKITPNNEKEFKIYWLKGFVQELQKIDFAIRYILDLPKIDHSKSKPVNILKIMADFEDNQKKRTEKIKMIFSNSKPKQENLNFYYSNILPDYIQEIDNLFFQIERMRNSFNENFSYLGEKNENLKDIVFSLQKSILKRFEGTTEQVTKEDYTVFIFELRNSLSRLKTDKNLKGEKVSNFITYLENRIEFLKENKPDEIPETDPGQPQQNVKKEPVTKLKELFEDPEKYTKIMQILIDAKHIDKRTHYWIDEKKETEVF